MRRVGESRARCAAALCAVTLCLVFVPATCDFHRGDLIATSRRAQFHGSRTQWHDLLARHCPIFGVDSVVAISLPEPRELRADDSYKLAFSFDHDRHLTGWMTIFDAKTRAAFVERRRAVEEERRKAKGKGKKKTGGASEGETDGAAEDAESSRESFDFEKDFDSFPPYVPMIEVSFTRGAAVVRRARSKIVAVDPRYLKRHVELVREFHNESVWPKHVLVRYAWETEADSNEDSTAVSAVFVFSIAFVVAAARACASYRAEISEFVDVLAAEEDRKRAASVEMRQAGGKRGAVAKSE
jgi:hypothetical protein